MRLAARWQAQEGWQNEPGWETALVPLSTGLAEVVSIGQGEPIVLVPGLAGGWRLLAPLARRLTRTHRVVMYNLLDDRSGEALRSRLADHAADLAELLNRLRIERPALFGISFGAAIALEHALNSPQSIGTMILYGGAAQAPTHLGYQILKRILERIPLPTDQPFFNQFFNLLHGGVPETPELADFVVRRCWETDQGRMAGRLRALDGFDVAHQLWQLDAPTLVLGGSRDVVVPASSQQALAAALPHARFECIEGAGHVGFLTHREEVARRVSGYLQRVRAACA